MIGASSSRPEPDIVEDYESEIRDCGCCSNRAESLFRQRDSQATWSNATGSYAAVEQESKNRAGIDPLGPGYPHLLGILY